MIFCPMQVCRVQFWIIKFVNHASLPNLVFRNYEQQRTKNSFYNKFVVGELAIGKLD